MELLKIISTSMLKNSSAYNTNCTILLIRDHSFLYSCHHRLRRCWYWFSVQMLGQFCWNRKFSFASVIWIWRREKTIKKISVLDVGGNSWELFQGKPMQSSRGWKPNPYSAPVGFEPGSRGGRRGKTPLHQPDRHKDVPSGTPSNHAHNIGVKLLGWLWQWSRKFCVLCKQTSTYKSDTKFKEKLMKCNNW